MQTLWFIIFSILVSSLSLYATTEEISLNKNSLIEAWGVDSHTTNYLCQYFKSFIENPEAHYLADFIKKSQQLDIQFPLDQPLIKLHEDDGVIRATKFHPIVYETPYVRILAGCAAPGEKAPLHNHIWKSLLLAFSEVDYIIQYANGATEYLYLSPGTYVLPPEDLYACINVGKTKENCLRFEVKASHSKEENTMENTTSSSNAFEAEIAYFYGVPDKKPLVEAYLAALEELRYLDGEDTKNALSLLEKAYQSVAQQRNWEFDTKKAAELELQIILGNMRNASFDTVMNLMKELYTTVFQSNTFLIEKAAMMRTFLYQYKALAFKTTFCIQEEKFLLELAKISKEFLDCIED